MNEPPNSRYCAALAQRPAHRVDDPPSGFGTCQTSFTPSAQICGFSPVEAEAVDRGARQVALRALGEHGHPARRCRSPARSSPSGSPSRPRPLSPVRTPTTRPCSTSSLSPPSPGRTIAPPRLGLLGEEAAELRERDDPVAVVAHRRRRRDPQRALARSGGRRPRPAPRRRSACPSSCSSRPLKSRRSARGFTTAPESRCEPGCLPFSSTRDRHVAEPLRARPGRSSSSWPSRIAHASPAGPAADDQDADLDALVRRSVGAATTSVARERRREVGGAGRSHRARLRARTSSVELRDDLVQVADDAEVGEVEDRRVRVLVDRDDHARALHADLVLDRAGDAERDVELRRDGLARSARPASSTGTSRRRRPRASPRPRRRAPPRAPRRARSPPARRGRGRRRRSRRRPRSTGRSPPPAPARPSRAVRREVLRASTSTASTVGRARRSRPGRTRPSGRARAAASLVQPTSTRTVSPSAGRLPTSSPPSSARSVRSQLRPASSRAARPAATSAASTEAAKRTFVGARSRDDRRERVDARLRQRRLERGVVDDVDRRRAVRAGRRGDARPRPADDDARDVAAERRAPSRARRATPFWSSPSWCSRKTRVAHRSFFSARKSTIFSAARAVVLDLDLVALGGRRRRARGPPCASRPSPARVGLDAEVGERQRLLRLRLRAHDPLQRRVARLVDRVGDGDDGRAAAPRSRRSRTRSGACPCTVAAVDRRARRPARSAAGAAGRRRPPRGRRRRSRVDCWPKRTRSAPSRSSASASA